MSVGNEEVKKIAKLARLELTGDEVTALGADLNAILGYVDQLSALDTTGVPTLEHAAEFGDSWRDDENRPSLPRERSLEVAPRSVDGCFAVPKIIE